jgi:hypothetical protein
MWRCLGVSEFVLSLWCYRQWKLQNSNFEQMWNRQLIPVAIKNVASVCGFMISLVLLHLVILLIDHPAADHMMLSCDEAVPVMLYLECTADRQYLSEPFIPDIQLWHLSWLCLCCKLLRTLTWSLQCYKPIPLCWYSTRFCLFLVFLFLPWTVQKKKGGWCQ